MHIPIYLRSGYPSLHAIMKTDAKTTAMASDKTLPSLVFRVYNEKALDAR